MARDLHVRFSPFGSLRLSNAPAAVLNLLERRWMVEPSEGLGTTFELVWQPDPSAAAPQGPAAPKAAAAPQAAGDETGQVQWRPVPEPGRLGNGAGTIEPSWSRRSAVVRYVPGAVTDSLRFEALVEAALAVAWAARGVHFVHGCAFELAGRSVVALGGSGRGKSTLACAVAASGGRVVSDDSLLMGRSLGSASGDGCGEVVVRAARRHVWLRPGSERLAAILESRGAPLQAADDGRLRLDRDRFPRLFSLAARPDRLVVLAAPDAANSTSRLVDLTPLTRADTLAALVRATSALYLTDARFGTASSSPLGGMAEFAEALPGSRLRLSRALLDRPEESLAALVASLP